jgi:hypothetical protein
METEFANGYNVNDLYTKGRYFERSNEGDKLILVDIGSIRKPTILFVEKQGKENLNRTEYLFNDLYPLDPNKPLERFAFFVPEHRFAPKKSKTKKSNTKKSKPKKSKTKKSKKSSDKRKLAGYERFLHTQMKLMKDDPKSDKEKMVLIRKLWIATH